MIRLLRFLFVPGERVVASEPASNPCRLPDGPPLHPETRRVLQEAFRRSAEFEASRRQAVPGVYEEGR